MGFNCNAYYGYLVRGDLTEAIGYVKQFPEQSKLYERFMSVFDREQYVTYDVDAGLNEILAIYQRYYREAFYLCFGKEQAEENLRQRLADYLNVTDGNITLEDLEDTKVAELFQSKGLRFLGGKTDGYYGPYIWRTEETAEYEVELPEGIQSYSVKLLDGFISLSWLAYLSFGEITPGGWAGDDGVIRCVRSSYDFESENFKVSLLKHEAQHAMDKAQEKNMSSAELEYRAKLVELIYSRERNLLELFAQEANAFDESNGHAVAAHRIVEGFSKELDDSHVEITALPISEIQRIARRLFEESRQKADGRKNAAVK